MSKSVLYAANTSSQATTAAGTITNFGTIVRRYGSNVKLSGGNAEIVGAGYYAVDVNVTFTSAGAGTETATIYIDGVAVPGASASITVASGDVVSLVIPAVVRESCCRESAITVALSGVAGVISNAAIRVIKL